MASYRRNLTDDQLLHTSLVIKDLAELAGSVDYPPDPNLRPEIVGEYHFDTKTEQAQRCCHCPQHQPHWNGFVVTNETGKLHLLGGDCGLKHYGLAFSQAKREHSDMVSRQKYVRRVKDLAATADNIVAALRAFSSGRDILGLWTKQLEFRRASDVAFNALEALAQGELPLFVNDRVRDFEREARRDESAEAALGPGEKGELYKLERRTIGQLQGRGFFTRQATFGGVVSSCVDAVTVIADTVRAGTDDLTTHQIRLRWTELNRAGRELLQTIDAINSAHAFFSDDNIARMAQWASSSWPKHFEIRPTRRGMGIKVVGGSATEVARLGPINLPTSLPWTNEA